MITTICFLILKIIYTNITPNAFNTIPMVEIGHMVFFTGLILLCLAQDLMIIVKLTDGLKDA